MLSNTSVKFSSLFCFNKNLHSLSFKSKISKTSLLFKKNLLDFKSMFRADLLVKRRNLLTSKSYNYIQSADKQLELVPLFKIFMKTCVVPSNQRFIVHSS